MQYLTPTEMSLIVDYLRESDLLRAGCQTNINHEGCPAGWDTKKRLYIKVTDDNTKVLAYCQHCGFKGARNLRQLTSAMALSGKGHVVSYTSPNTKLQFKPSAQQLQEWEYWSGIWHDGTPANKAIMGRDLLLNEFPFKYFKDDELNKLSERDFYDIRFHGNPPTHVCIPRIGERGLLGVDVRAIRDMSVYEAKTRSKWFRALATTEDGQEAAGRLMIYNTNAAKVGVLVEDPISAMKCDIAGYAGIAVTGSSLASDDAFKLSLLFDKMVVWLDNDSDFIKQEALTAKARLGIYGVNVGIVLSQSDPKKYSVAQIDTLLTAALNDEQTSLGTLTQENVTP